MTVPPTIRPGGRELPEPVAGEERFGGVRFTYASGAMRRAASTSASPRARPTPSWG